MVAQVGLINVVAPQQVFRYVVRLGVQQRLHGGLVALLKAAVQFFQGGAESRPPEQVCHQRDIFL